MPSGLIAPPKPYERQHRYKQWVECADARHATDGPRALPGDQVVTLCEKTVVVVNPLPGRPAPECPACDHRWREIEGITQREDHVPTPRNGRDLPVGESDET